MSHNREASRATLAGNLPPDVAELLADDSESARESCISGLYRLQLWADISLCVGPPGNQQHYLLHRLVIGGQSSFLRNLCKSDDPMPLDGLPIPEIEPVVFNHVVKWLYRGKLTERPEDGPVLAKVLEAAQRLKIHPLEQKAIENLQLILKKRSHEGKVEQKGSRGESSTSQGLDGATHGRRQAEASDTDAQVAVSSAPTATSRTEAVNAFDAGPKPRNQGKPSSPE
ncbi:hypothetical protein Dda_9237 [Drechslerella dactyloides]|uniref:BTB domain-containing protein n=1 Tax=Drechslerella dactyloides TaxID=74499 RepID=A0AAD6IRY8_DREDA|nr:hypothetical protein Dda_9237 [Drechslerella dactyloides]